ncbi:MAG: DUF2628 domain-containing protein [Acetobacteraceae bacterium]
MRVWTVHVKPETEPVLVREGFAWGAFLVPGLWFLLNRLWLVLALYLSLAVVAGVALSPLPEPLVGVIGSGVQLLIAFHARDLRRWTLARRGYREIGVVAARGGEDEALARLYAARRDLLAWGAVRA